MSCLLCKNERSGKSFYCKTHKCHGCTGGALKPSVWCKNCGCKYEGCYKYNTCCIHHICQWQYLIDDREYGCGRRVLEYGKYCVNHICGIRECYNGRNFNSTIRLIENTCLVKVNSFVFRCVSHTCAFNYKDQISIHQCSLIPELGNKHCNEHLKLFKLRLLACVIVDRYDVPMDIKKMIVMMIRNDDISMESYTILLK